MSQRTITHAFACRDCGGPLAVEVCVSGGSRPEDATGWPGEEPETEWLGVPVTCEAVGGVSERGNPWLCDTVHSAGWFQLHERGAVLAALQEPVTE